METIKIEARLRTRYTKSDIKTARRRGRVPAAVYGRGIEPFLIEVSTKSIVEVLRSEGALSTLVELSIPGQATKTAIIGDLDRDPITHGFLHVGFHNLLVGEKVHTQIPVHLIGTPRDVAHHTGLVDQTLETLDVRGLSGSLPTHIDVDISHLSVGEKIHVSDLSPIENVEFLSSSETPVVSILAVQHTDAAIDAADATVAANAATANAAAAAAG